MASQCLVKDYRGNLVENIHRGFIAIVDDQGNLIGKAGNPEKKIYYRSASKPIQALPILALGIDKEFGFTPEETTIMAGSHMGEPFHIEAIESILRKIGAPEEVLCMKPTYPGYLPRRDELICQNLPKRKVYHNCSGKHAAALAMAKFFGHSFNEYWLPEHPVQQYILETISIMSETPKEEIEIGIDGCGVPVFAVPLRNMALGAMKMACPDKISDKNLARAAQTLAANMNEHHLMVTGTDYICSMVNLDDNLVAKGGAQGVYAIGMREQRIGIAFKCEDGTEVAWPILINEIFKQLGYLNEAGRARVEKLTPTYIINDNDTVVGRREPCFNLFN